MTDDVASDARFQNKIVVGRLLKTHPLSGLQLTIFREPKAANLLHRCRRLQIMLGLRCLSLHGVSFHLMHSAIKQETNISL